MPRSVLKGAALFLMLGGLAAPVTAQTTAPNGAASGQTTKPAFDLTRPDLRHPTRDERTQINTLVTRIQAGSKAKDFATVLALTADLLVLQEKTFGPDHPITAATHRFRAEAFKGLGNVAAALKHDQRHFDILRQRLGADAAGTLESQITLAETLFQLGQTEQAMIQARAAFDLLTPQSAVALRYRSLKTISDVLESADRHGDALVVVTRIVALVEATIGADAPATSDWITKWEQVRIRALADGWGLSTDFTLLDHPPEHRHPNTAERAEIADITRRLSATLATPPAQRRGFSDNFRDFRRLVALQADNWGKSHVVTGRITQHLAEFLFMTAQTQKSLPDETKATLVAGGHSMNKAAMRSYVKTLGVEHPYLLLAMLRAAQELDSEDKATQAMKYGLTVTSHARTQGLKQLELGAFVFMAGLSDALKRTGLERPILIRILELADPDDPIVAGYQARLDEIPAYTAKSVLKAAQQADAIDRLKFAVTQHERILGPDHKEVIRLKQFAATMLLQMRSPAGAVDYLEDLASYLTNILGQDDDVTLQVRLDLARALVASGQTKQAADKLDTLITLFDGRSPDKDAQFFDAVDLRGTLLFAQGHAIAARDFIVAAMNDKAGSPGEKSAEFAQLLMTLTRIYAGQKQHDLMSATDTRLRQLLDDLGDAGLLVRLDYMTAFGHAAIPDFAERIRYIAGVYERANQGFGPYHRVTRQALLWTSLYYATLAIQLDASAPGRVDEAMSFIDRAISVQSQVSDGPDQQLSQLRAFKGILLHKAGRYREALENIRYSEAVTQDFMAEFMSASGELSAAQRDARLGDAVMSSVIRWDFAASPEASKTEAIAARDEAFAHMQAAGSGASQALVQAMARNTESNGDVADLVRSWTDSLRRRNAMEGQLGTAPQRKELGEQIDAIRARLAAQAPRFFELANPAPVAIGELQGAQGSAWRGKPLLDKDEALILLTPGHADAPGFIWAVTREGAAWAQIPQSNAVMLDQIGQMRATLDGGRVRGGVPLKEAVNGKGPRLSNGYDRTLAHGFYRTLFGDPAISALLKDKPNWILVPKGPLTGLPFTALVTRPPQGDDDDPAALRQTGWLGLEKALVVAPSVASVRALRRYANTDAPAQRAFFGLGDPSFSGKPRRQAGGARLGDGGGFFRDGTGNVDAVRDLPGLPGTRREIRAMAKILGASDADVLIGVDANEARLAGISDSGTLAQADIVLMATHGLLSGAFSGLAEPALALSPPSDGPEPIDRENPDIPADQRRVNDGLLKASEAARLKLNANWVILSACDTASGATPGADGLSGLARAFFYAGARALLVSHWPVDDAVAARLTTRTVSLAKNDRMGRAEALQTAMREIMTDTTNPAFSHPALWAPFQVIGDR